MKDNAQEDIKFKDGVDTTILSCTLEKLLPCVVICITEMSRAYWLRFILMTMKSVTSMCCLTWAYFFGTLSRAEHTIIQSPNQGNAFWLWKRWRREVCARGSYFSSTRHWCCRSLSMVLVSWPWLILIWSALTQFINEAMTIILGLTIDTLSAVMRCGTTSTCRIWRKGTK